MTRCHRRSRVRSDRRLIVTIATAATALGRTVSMPIASGLSTPVRRMGRQPESSAVQPRDQAEVDDAQEPDSGLCEALPQCVGRGVLLVLGDATREDLLLVGGQPAGPGDPV